MAFDASAHAKAIELTKLNLEMTSAADSGHPTSGASMAHLVTLLLYNHMRHDPASPRHPGSDRLILSEGHAVPIVYAAAADLGVLIRRNGQWASMTRDDAMTLRAIDSAIEGHPHPIEGFPFFDAATGSLGQGLSVTAGLAAAARLDGVDKRVYCLIGDGESREGQIWEAVDFIAEQNLTGVCPIFNCNAYGQSDKVAPQQTPEVTAKKLEAVGVKAVVVDGHAPSEIQAALDEHASRASNPAAAPMAIVAKTVKGWGTPSLQGGGLHGKAASDLNQALAELDATAHELGAAWTEGDLRIPPIPTEPPTPPKPTGQPPTLTEALKRFGKEDALSKGKWATRRAYGAALRVLGYHDRRVVGLDGDVKNSTYSQEFYKDSDLGHRFFESRIAEQNMISVCAGLSAAGKIPMASTFGKFVTRAYDQLEMAINSGANLKIVGSHCGASLGADGPSQMALPDVAWFRSWSRVTRADGSPAMYLLQPADAYAAYRLTLEMAEHDGPCYMRVARPDVPLLYDDQTPFELGGHHVVAEGSDLLVVAAGYMVHEARKALDGLKAAGIEPTLVDLYSIPFDEQGIAELARAHQGMVLTAEDNYGAGTGSAVADAVTAEGGTFRVQQMHARRIPKSGRSPDDVMRHLGLSADDIVRTATSMMEPAGK